MKELTNRLLFLLLAIIIYRFGSHVPIPGVSLNKIGNLFSTGDTTFLGLFNVFSGGALSRLSVFSLGIVPYISSSIIMQLMQAFIPQLENLKKEGEAGRAKINQYTRLLTLCLSMLQGLGLTMALANEQVFISDNLVYLLSSTISISAGCMFLMWLGEQINERGIGNGMSMLIFVSIVSTLPSTIFQSFEQARQGVIQPLSLIIILAILICVVFAIVVIERAQRKIPINYSNKQAMRDRGMNNSMYSFFPLKINVSGVIPAIFASSILLLPFSLAQWLGDSGGFLSHIALLLSPNQPLYLILFIAALFFFSFLYASIVFNPNEVANNLKRSNAFIPGIRPGKATADFFDLVLTRLTLVGAFYIATVSLLPQLISVVVNVPFLFAGTSILIVIVVVMDFISQVQSHLYSNQYSNLLKRASSRQYGNKR